MEVCIRISTDQKEIAKYLLKLKHDKFSQRLNSAYGLPKNKVDPVMARIGFDGQENRLGWSPANIQWIFDNYHTVEKLLKDAEFIRRNFLYAVFCGMGGSGLSVQLVKDTVGEKKARIYSLRTTDPKAIKEILDEISRREGSLEKALLKTLVIAVSKSGSTIETVYHKKYFEELYKKLGIEIKEHLWVVTDKGSPMDTGDYPQRQIQLNGRSDIGGRWTSPATGVFLLPLAILAPKKLKPVLERAKVMNRERYLKKDVFFKLGAFLYYWAVYHKKDKLTMFMSREFKDIPMWAEQLFEESLGKDGKGVSLFYGEKLSVKGLKPVELNDRVFFRIKLSGKAPQEKLWRYLSEHKYPVFEINAGTINSIGGILLGLQRAVAAIGYLWDICFVDQPAVEGYKKATKEMMSHPGEIKPPSQWGCAGYKKIKLYYGPLIEAGIISEDELKAEVQAIKGGFEDAPAVYAAILSLLLRKGRLEAVELTSYGGMTGGLRSILEEARYNLFTRGLKIPAKLGEGPDKNHSYHQNIEAGKDMWFSVYFMASVLEQPEALEFDSRLLKAQAIGTVQSLVNKRRRVVLIELMGTIRESEKDLKDFFARALRFLSKQGIV